LENRNSGIYGKYSLGKPGMSGSKPKDINATVLKKYIIKANTTGSGLEIANKNKLKKET
jgi:hypothetical protein